MNVSQALLRPVRLTAAAVAALVLFATPAVADISIDFDDLITGPIGSLRTVAQVDVPADLVGQTCLISIAAENQASVHPGNDLVITTGETETVIQDVEDEVDGARNESYAVTVGPAILVQLRFGSDGMSSLGFGLSFDCDQSVIGAPLLDGQGATAEPSDPPSGVVGDAAASTTVVPVAAGCDVNGPGTAGAVNDGASDPETCPSSTTEPPPSPACSANPASVDPAAGSQAVDGASADPGPCSTSTSTSTPSSTAAVDGGGAQAATTTTTGPPAALQLADALPQTPVAAAIVAAPAYTG